MEDFFKSVPRDLSGLMNLPREKRVELYTKVAEETEELSPTLEEFKSLGDTSQCNVLLGCIKQFSEDDDGYFVVPIALPCRSETNNSRNEKDWSAFGQRVENALNDMRDDGLQIQPIAAFQDHGVLIIGFKDGAQARVLPKVVSLKELLAQIVGEPQKPEHVLMSKIAEAVRRNIAETGTMNDEHMRAIIESICGDLIDVKGFLAFVDEEVVKHSAGCTNDGCIVDRLLHITRQILVDRLRALS